MPTFIDWAGDQQAPPPYKFEGVDLWSFTTSGDLATVTGVLDKFLNAPLASTGVVYRPWKTLTGRAVIQVHVGWYEKMRSEPWANRGFVSQHELLLIVPVSRYDDGRWTGWRLFAPLVFVDNPWSVVTGNTVIGYPKALADFTVDHSVDGPYPIAVESLAFATYNPNRVASSQPLLDITGSFGPVPIADDMFWPLGPFETLHGRGGGLELDKDTYLQIRETLAPTVIPGLGYDVVQLKQIRDAVQPATAKILGVYEYRVTLEGYFGASLLQPAVVALHDTASWPITSMLGLSRTFPSPLSYWQRAAYSMSVGTLVGP